LQADKQSGRETSRGETSGHKSGGLVSVLDLGPSACPKNARDLTVINTTISFTELYELYGKYFQKTL
jgi:hypothetical protein